MSTLLLSYFQGFDKKIMWDINLFESDSNIEYPQLISRGRSK